MKKLLIVAFLFGSAFSVYAQLVMSNGSQIVVSSGSQLVVNDITNTSGTIDNDGTVSIKGKVTNNGGGLFDATSTGTVTFTGTSAQEITGTATTHFYGTLNINNSNGVGLTNTATGAAQEVHGALAFTSGKLTLNNFDLTLGGTADPTGVSATSYIVTNGTGQLKRTVAASDILYPVGNSAYNPVTLNNSGTSDTYGVKAVDYEPANSLTNHMVNRSWTVTESSSGNSNLAVTAQWNVGEELTSFDRTNSTIGLTTDAGANYSWGAVGAATGSNPYTRVGSGFTGVGTFAVGDYYYGGIVVDLKAFLAGAYNSTNHNMDKDLNTAGLIPLSDPYSLSTTVTAVPSGAVDWIKIELRDKNDNTSVLYSFARFINQSGQIIEENDDNLTLTGVPMDSYYIAIRHRNHFGVMSASTVNLASAPTVNFTTAQATAYQDGSISTNDAMKAVEGSVFGLWDGDANDDGQVQYASGANSDQVTVLNAVGSTTPGNIVSNTYTKNDVNLDGDVQYASGANSDQVSILNVVGPTTPGNILSAHIPE